MYHPGPPRFTSVGESVELAPRHPDPEATYRWSITDAPAASDAELGDDPVEHLAPDAPGTYTVELETERATHELTVRAFPDERRDVRVSCPRFAFPEELDAVDAVSVVSTFNEWVPGRDHAVREEGAYVFETRLPPGEYDARFLPDHEFAEGVTVPFEVEGPGRPRVHLTGTVDGDAATVEARASANPESELDDGEVDVEFYVDDRDEAALEVEGRRAELDLSGESVRVHAVAVGERYSVADTVTLGADGVTRPNDPPEWVDDAVIYEIFVRQFAGERVDTTFSEIERRLPYLEELGVDCLWLTPVLESPTRHGYHTTDYFDTADDLGSRAEFESLVAACHDRGMKLVFDLVINHSSEDHPYFQMAAAGTPDYRDWYVWADGAAETYFNWERIPNFDYDTLAVRRFLLDVVEEWASVVDGFRCDVAWGVPHGFWKEVRERVKAEDESFLLLDETVPRDPQYHEAEFDMHYDTDFYETLLDVGEGEKSASAVLDGLEAAQRAGFPESARHMRYVENHDEDRYRDRCGRGALKAAAAATLTAPGVPMVYYGQERGMTDYRGPMAWRDGDDALTDFHRSLIELRNEHRVLRRGDLARVEWEAVDGSDDVVAFARETDEERVAVVLNFGATPADVRVEATLGPDLLSGETPEGPVTVDSVRVFPVR